MTDDSTPKRSLDTPYAHLTPDFVLDALDAVGLRGDGRLLQLNSYENRVFQVFLEDGTVVVPKFYRPGRWSDAQILEEHCFAAELRDAEIPIVAPLALSAAPVDGLTPLLLGDPPTLAKLVHEGTEYRYSVTPRQSGREPSTESREHLSWIGRFIGRMHAVGTTKPFKHRLSLDVATFGWQALAWLREQDIVPPDALDAWNRQAQTALQLAEDAFRRVAPTVLRIHGDCHLGNLLWTDNGPHFVDLDDAMNGPAIQDLWMLLSPDDATRRMEVQALLAGYEDFMAFDDRELALVEPLRTLRLVHHSAWIARRWDDPAFPAAFPWFGEPAYWQQQTQQLCEQQRAMEQTHL